MIQHPADAEGSSGEEDDKEPDEPEIEDSQILEDLPNETEVRILLLIASCSTHRVTLRISSLYIRV